MNFSGAIKAFQSKANDRARRAAIAVAEDIHGNVVALSPVDSGRYRANNRISLNDLPGDATMSVDVDGGATISAGKDVLSRFSVGDTVFLFNNVPYSVAIEYGNSEQAPHGVYRLGIQRTLERLQDIVDSAKGQSRE